MFYIYFQVFMFESELDPICHVFFKGRIQDRIRILLVQRTDRGNIEEHCRISYKMLSGVKNVGRKTS